MRVSLNIAEDRELREAIRAMIDGQVKSVVREGLPALVTQVIKEEMHRKLGPIVERLVHQAVRDQVSMQLKTYKGVDISVLIKDKVADLFVDRFGSK